MKKTITIALLFLATISSYAQDQSGSSTPINNATKPYTLKH